MRALEVNREVLPGCYRVTVKCATGKALQALCRAVLQQFVECPAIGQFKLRGDFAEWVKDERACLHVIVRHLQAWQVKLLLPEQQDVQVERARPPAFGFALPALLQFDLLQVVEQLQWLEAGVQRCHGIQVIRLIGRS